MEPRPRESTTELQQPSHNNWSGPFVEYLKAHLHGDNLQALAEPKPEVAEMAEHFGGNHMPPDALEVAKVAHMAELAHHLNLGPNIGRALSAAFGEQIQQTTYTSWETDTDLMPIKYTFGLLRDFPVIADFIKTHEKRCDKVGHEYVDIEGLVELVERVNFESIIIKSALDYSNFLLLDRKETLTEKEQKKMKRIVTTIKTVDSPLLALTGFDALEAEILSKAYIWELQQSAPDPAHHPDVIHEAEAVFDSLGGREQLAHTSEHFLEELFAADAFQHDRVTSEQQSYGVFFTDGTAAPSDTAHGDELRVLARLKSVGSTAKKMHALYAKTGEIETPMDIIGVTLIAKDKDHMSECLNATFERLSALPVAFKSAPSRYEQIHVKGRPDFLQMFGKHGDNAGLYAGQDLNVEDEPCDNGYEAVKITALYSYNGVDVPVEIQITHETARKESRVGLGSHTLFKLMKLAKDAGNISITQLSTEDLIQRLQRISARKHKFDKSSYETNGSSTVRATHLFRDIWKREFAKLAGVAIRDKIRYNHK